MIPVQDEKDFFPTFLQSLSVPELVGLQHTLRSYPEDAKYLAEVLAEIKRRATTQVSEHIDVGADVPGGGAI